jgi:hypothetical protein
MLASLFSRYPLVLVLFPRISFKVTKEQLILVFSCYPSECAASKVSAKFDGIYHVNTLLSQRVFATYCSDDQGRDVLQISRLLPISYIYRKKRILPFVHM